MINPNTITRVKGDAESSYRDGDVNLTASNIGAASTSEAVKSITRNGTTFTATKADGSTFTFTQQDNNTTDLTTRQVTKSIQARNGGYVSVQAPSVSGYTFLCWLQPATSGWCGACYMENPAQANTNVWVGSTQNNSWNGSVLCTALYRKS